MPSPVRHTGRAIHECHCSFAFPYEHALDFIFPEGGHYTASLPSDLAELQKEASVSTEHCLASGRCGSSCPEPPTDKNHKQLREKPWGAGEQAKVEPDRKEGVCTPTAEEGLSCPDQIPLLPQQRAQSVAHAVLPGPGWPSHSFAWTSPRSFNHMQKKKKNLK